MSAVLSAEGASGEKPGVERSGISANLLQQREGAITHLSRRNQNEGSPTPQSGSTELAEVLRRARQPGCCATTLCGRDVGLRRAQSSRFAESGYFHLVPPGQDPLFRCKIFLKLALMERSGTLGEYKRSPRSHKALTPTPRVKNTRAPLRGSDAPSINSACRIQKESKMRPMF